MIKGKHYQLRDYKGVRLGILYTEDPALQDIDFFQKLWEKWFYKDGIDINDFVRYLNEENYQAERIFVEEVCP